MKCRHARHIIFINRRDKAIGKKFRVLKQRLLLVSHENDEKTVSCIMQAEQITALISR
jgi:hypothetical protein